MQPTAIDEYVADTVLTSDISDGDVDVHVRSLRPDDARRPLVLRSADRDVRLHPVLPHVVLGAADGGRPRGRTSGADRTRTSRRQGDRAARAAQRFSCGRSSLQRSPTTGGCRFVERSRRARSCSRTWRRSGLWALAQSMTRSGRRLMLWTVLAGAGINAVAGALQLILQLEGGNLGLIGGRSDRLDPASDRARRVHAHRDLRVPRAVRHQADATGSARRGVVLLRGRSGLHLHSCGSDLLRCRLGGRSRSTSYTPANDRQFDCCVGRRRRYRDLPSA